MTRQVGRMVVTRRGGHVRIDIMYALFICLSSLSLYIYIHIYICTQCICVYIYIQYVCIYIYMCLDKF